MNNKFFNPVSIGASLAVFFIFVVSICFPQAFFDVLSWIKNVFVMNISWFYVLVIFCLFCFCLYLMVSPYGNIRLGSSNQPQYSTFTWLAMLFSAGMGTGLLFSGVYEPLYHYFLPPMGVGATQQSLELSFRLTFLHWGFSGWVVYTCMGLAISYFCFHKNLPFRLSSMLYPFLKDKTNGFLGISVDIFSIIAILFGVAVTLGRGTLQINSGLKHLFNIPFSELSQGVIILVLTLIAIGSLLSGLNRGIRYLSEINIILCICLALFVLFAGPTVYLFNSFVEYTGSYLQNLIADMTRIHSLGPTEWRSQWTILYWAWWIAWSPFVGLFIARISNGRTIREFISGCLIIPALLSCLWFIIYGGAAIYYHIENLMNLEPFLKTEYSILIYKFLEYFPLSKLASFVTLISIILFFITSSDSASYVVHRIASQTSSTMNKIYWASVEGFLALMLIFSGGIKSLELLVIITAFPLTLFICLICYGFFKEIKQN